MKNTVEAPAPLPNETDVAIHAKRYLRQNGYIVKPYKRFFMAIGRFLRVIWWLARYLFGKMGGLIAKFGGSLAGFVKVRRQKKIERAKTNLEESIRSEKILQEQLKALEKVEQKEKEKESVEEVSSKQMEPKSDLSAEQTESKPDLSAKIQELSPIETSDLSKVEADDVPDAGNKSCKSCQAELPLNARFCRKCGTKVA
jgi:hypothetical protein